MIHDNVGSVKGGTGEYLVVLGQYRAVLVGTYWYWVSLTWYRVSSTWGVREKDEDDSQTIDHTSSSLPLQRKSPHKILTRSKKKCIN